MSRAFDDQTEQKIVARYQAGESLGDIADDMFCSPATIRNISKRLGFMRKAGWTTPDLKPADKMNKYRALADDYNTGNGSPIELMRRYGYTQTATMYTTLKHAEKRGIYVKWRRKP